MPKILNVISLLCIALAILTGCERRAIFGSSTVTDPKNTVEDGGLTQAVLAVFEKNSHNFGNVDNAVTEEVTLSLINNGVVEATNIAVDTDLGAPFTFKGGAYPGTGGSCGADLAAETTCDLIVEFTPAAGGTFSDTFVLSYDSESTAKTFTFALNGNSGEADLTTDQGLSIDFANTLVGNATNATVTITNDGEITARLITDSGAMESPFSYLDGSYPGTGGTCTSNLDPGDDCTVIISYTPTAQGTDLGAWGIDYVTVDSAGAASLILNGSSGIAALELSDGPEYDFGSTIVGNSTNYTFTLSNTGNFEAVSIVDTGTLSGAFDYLGGSYPGIGGDCGVSLDASDTCDIVISHVPTSAGTDTATLELSYDDGENTGQLESVDLTASATEAVIEANVGSSYNYFRVAKNSTNEATITLTNTGNITANSLSDAGGLTTPFRYKGFAYPGIGGTCGSSLTSGSSCDIVIEYIPTGSGTGLLSHSDTLIINYNDGAGMTTVNVSVSGEAGLGLLTISSGSWGTDVVGSTNARTFTVTNTGTFNVTSMAEGTAFGAPFTWRTTGSYPGGGTCDTSLAPGGSCTLRLNFDPVLAQAYADTLEIDYNDGESAQTETESLTGTGALASLSLSLATHDFGTESYNSGTGTQLITLSNTGGWQATGVSLTGLANPFSVTGSNCAATINAGDFCTFTVEFTPTAVTTWNDILDVDYNDGQSAQNTNMDFDGEGVNDLPVSFASVESVPMNDPGTTFTLSATDTNGDPLTYTIVSGASDGTVGVPAGNQVTYTPDPAYSGPDSFTFRASDAFGNSNVSTVTITVTP